MFIPSRRLRWAVHVTRIREARNAQRILMGNPYRRVQVVGKVILREINCGGWL
jgi:hypothetical protein